jgi:hypothetical protein
LHACSQHSQPRSRRNYHKQDCILVCACELHTYVEPPGSTVCASGRFLLLSSRVTGLLLWLLLPQLVRLLSVGGFLAYQWWKSAARQQQQ